MPCLYIAQGEVSLLISDQFSMNDHTNTVNWRSIAQNLVSTHRLFERESKIILSKLLLEKSQLKTRFQENIQQTLDYEGKIHSLERDVASMAEKSKLFQQKEQSVSDRIKELQNENAQLGKLRIPLSEAIAEKDCLSGILKNVAKVVDLYRIKFNFTSDKSSGQVSKEVS